MQPLRERLGRAADYSATPRALSRSDTTMSYSLTVICTTPAWNPAAFAWTYGLDPFGSIRCTATSNGTPLVQSSTSPSNTPLAAAPEVAGSEGIGSRNVVLSS